MTEPGPSPDRRPRCSQRGHCHRRFGLPGLLGLEQSLSRGASRDAMQAVAARLGGLVGQVLDDALADGLLELGALGQTARLMPDNDEATGR